MASLRNVMSLDVEEWFQVDNLKHHVHRDEWDGIAPRVEASTKHFLDLLDEGDAHATFFILGWIAERHPALVEEIHRRGHEIASHGYGHELLTELDPESFERDLERTEEILEGIVGEKPIGYRAPSFTVKAGTFWALDVLHRRGYRYDTSVFPVKRGRYGCPDAPRHLHPARIADGRTLWSFPLLTRRVLGKNLPLAGGGYLRLFPIPWVSHAIGRMNREGWPAMIYLHPWELDPDHPVPVGVPRKKRFMHTVNLARTADKIRYLVKRWTFASARDVLEETLAARPELLAAPAEPVLRS